MGCPRSRITFLLVFFLVAIAFPSHASIRTVEGFVQKVSDGDTVTLITRDGTKLRVRLYGIDAPEMRHEKKPGQPFGETAKRALTGNSVSIQWVRWAPDSPIPITRLIAKYGKPEKSDFNSDDFKPYKSWPTRGITAYTSDDGKRVHRIDFNFTEKDYKAAFDSQRPTTAIKKEGKEAAKKKPKAQKK
jgi:hypothetical protein